MRAKDLLNFINKKKRLETVHDLCLVSKNSASFIKRVLHYVYICCQTNVMGVVYCESW